jgi:hypothetical protein
MSEMSELDLWFPRNGRERQVADAERQLGKRDIRAVVVGKGGEVRVNRVGAGWMDVDLGVRLSEVQGAIDACRKRGVMLIRKDLDPPPTEMRHRSIRFF